MQTDPEEDYARGWVPFLDCKIFLDSRPLIPRTETEHWAEKAIEEIRARAQTPARALDLFAGSGAIGVAALKHLPELRVDFGEIEAAHFPTIEKNIRENGIDPRRTRVIETDVWSGITGTYDVIFANPPYLSESKKELIQQSVLAHEPPRALFAGEGGFGLIRRTLEGVRAHLNPSGLLYLEHDPDQAVPIRALAAELGLDASVRKDQFGIERWSVLAVA